MFTVLQFSIAMLALVLIPVVPKMVRLRIRFFRWIHWDWSADVLEEHFERWVFFFRIALLGVATVLFLIGT
ncbi:uncharacterized protein METZ01_LOCUS147197 [marine metagenome]|uniref:Aerotolerance regulator N-terminal domain-containing protein n=1 Tax=marine metagenome TaxID=408172 RepID=A0A382A069_9ZZZZ